MKTLQHGRERSSLDDLGPPVRDRSANLIEEAWISGPDADTVTSFSFFQAMLYLVIVGTLAAVVIWGLWPP